LALLGSQNRAILQQRFSDPDLDTPQPQRLDGAGS
jgi:hypothetical protein